MTNSIIHIPLKSKQIIKPIEWNIFKRVMASNRMNYNPCKHHQIRKIRKSEFLERKDEQQNNN